MKMRMIAGLARWVNIKMSLVKPLAKSAMQINGQPQLDLCLRWIANVSKMNYRQFHCYNLLIDN